MITTSEAISIYKVHPGSWRRVPEEGNRRLTWAELAAGLADYVSEMGYTDVALAPDADYVFDGADFRKFTDMLRDRGIGVILEPAAAEREGASLLSRMAGDEWRKFAHLRLLYGSMFSRPGVKRIFMGNDFGQWRDWNPDESLDWHLLSEPKHKGLQRWVRDLNTFLRGAGFDSRVEPIEAGGDAPVGVQSFLRHGAGEQTVLVVSNSTPAVHRNYRVGAPSGGCWREVLNGDAVLYGGSGQGNMGSAEASPLPVDGRPWSLSITVPPLATVMFRSSGGDE